jgi:hypothetical protein
MRGCPSGPGLGPKRVVRLSFSGVVSFSLFNALRIDSATCGSLCLRGW